jgi:hypothetical protein
MPAPPSASATAPVPSWGALVTSRAFVLTWLPMLLSTCGTFMLLLALAADVMRRTDSATAAAAVYGAQWLLPMAAPPLVAWLNARLRTGRALALSEAVSAVITLLVAVAVAAGSFPAVLGLLVWRGLTESITKSLRVVALKQAFDGPSLERASTLFGTSFYLGGALGGIAGTLLIDRLSLPVIAVLDAMTFAVAGVLYLLLPKHQAPAPAAGVRPGTTALLRRGALAVWRTPALFRGFVWLTLTAMVFQGFHNAARTIIPMRDLGLGATAVTRLQVLSSVAILLGVACVARFMQGRCNGVVAAGWMVGLTCAAMTGATLAGSVGPAFTLYFLFIFCFEVAFTKFNNAMVLACPAAHIAAVASLNNAVTSSGLMVFVLLTGVLADLHSTQFAAMFLALIAMLAFALSTRRRPAADATAFAANER